MSIAPPSGAPTVAANGPIPLRIGALLRGRFELVDVVGRGGMSTVYRARDRIRVLAGSSDPEVAIKVLTAPEGLPGQAIEFVHREAQYLLELLHPNIVRVFDSDQDGLHHFVVLELLQGRPLGKVLHDLPGRRLPINMVVRIVRAAAAGLAHAHARGIIHGDLKPNNLFITLDGDVKLLDFGAAQMMNHYRLDEHGAGVGEIGALTPLYASPGMIAGEAPVEGDDVFSLAVLAYVMATGSHPFGGKTAAEAGVAGLRPARPGGMAGPRWRALQRGLALEPADRTATIGEFAGSFAKPPLLDRLLG